MKNRVAVRLAQNPLLVALLLVAVCGRVLIPTGFMPGPGGLILCNGYAPVPGAVIQTLSHDMSKMDMPGMDMTGTSHLGGHPSHDGGAPHHEGPSLCPFAAAATTMASGHTAVLVVSLATESRPVQLPSQPFVPRGTIVPTRLPRGPPSLA